jgi:hypothetical protein
MAKRKQGEMTGEKMPDCPTCKTNRYTVTSVNNLFYCGRSGCKRFFGPTDDGDYAIVVEPEDLRGIAAGCPSD